MNVLNNDIDIININNNNNPPYNNASNDQNKPTDSDTNECNNNSTFTNTRPYNPNRDPFLNEYNHELFQPILHREVVSGFSWLHNIKATSTPAYMSNLMNTHATAPEQEAGTSAPAPCEDPYQSHAPEPTTAVTTSKSKNIPTPNPNPNPHDKPIEAPIVIPTETPTPVMSLPQVVRSHTSHTTPTTTPVPCPTHPQPSPCHVSPNPNHSTPRGPRWPGPRRW